MSVDTSRIDRLARRFRGESVRDDSIERERRVLAEQLHDAAERQQGRIANNRRNA